MQITDRRAYSNIDRSSLLKKIGIKLSVLTTLSALLLGVGQSSYACRYSVRDIGFSPLSQDIWTLLHFRNSSSAANQTLTTQLLENSEVEYVPVSINSTPSTLEKYFTKGRGEQYKLINQRDRDISYAIPAINSIKSSPLRKLLKQELPNSFATILIVEGGDQKSEVIESILQTQLPQFIDTMILMPKEVEEHPKVITISIDNYRSDTTLIKMMGIDIHNGESSVVVLYGRGRIIGEALTPDQAKRGDAIKLLNIIGSDCECGLDRDWLLGTLLPISWSDTQLKAISERISVDIQNPMTLVEMGQIVSKEITLANKDSEITFAPKESSLTNSSETGNNNQSNSQSKNRAIPSASFNNNSEYQHQSASDISLLQNITGWHILGGILTLFITLTALLMLRRRSN